MEGFPADLTTLAEVEVEYITMKGWNSSIGACRSYSELPKEVRSSHLSVCPDLLCSQHLQCREYVEFIEEFVGVPIKYIGVGPKREDMIMR